MPDVRRLIPWELLFEKLVRVPPVAAASSGSVSSPKADEGKGCTRNCDVRRTERAENDRASNGDGSSGSVDGGGGGGGGGGGNGEGRASNGGGNGEALKEAAAEMASLLAHLDASRALLLGLLGTSIDGTAAASELHRVEDALHAVSSSLSKIMEVKS